MDNGYGYETDDGIYFDISKFPEYGQLSASTSRSELPGPGWSQGR